MTLNLNADDLNTCVACGLCLPHCPTFRATGEEALSPRGRIEAMRAVQVRGAPIDDEFVGFMSTCVQCRGCEPACPSSVPFGQLMEGTREHLASAKRISPWWQRWGFRIYISGSRATAASCSEAAWDRSAAGSPRAGGHVNWHRRLVVYRLRHGCLVA
jgi:Fe-S oxidoreductase